MSYQVSYWEADGPNGEAQIRAVRIKKVEEAKALTDNRPIGCVRITLDRTDKQSPITRDLWIKPGYLDPFRKEVAHHG